jgi:hypothetical protein
MNREVTRLGDALALLARAFLSTAIAHDRKQIKVELDYDAGKRFEIWASRHSREIFGLIFQPDWMRTIGADTERPMRTLELDGIVITWPVERIALPNGEVTVERPPTHVIEIPPREPGVRPCVVMGPRDETSALPHQTPPAAACPPAD